MSFGASTPPTVLEGDYSTWTIYDSFTDADANDTSVAQEAVCIREETKILVIDCVSEYIKCYDIATKTLSARLMTGLRWSYSYYLQGVSHISAYGTYVVALDSDGTNVKVFKDGSVVKTLTDSDLGISSGQIRSISISPKGKYIIVSGYITAESAMGWVVLEGS